MPRPARPAAPDRVVGAAKDRTLQSAGGRGLGAGHRPRSRERVGRLPPTPPPARGRPEDAAHTARVRKAEWASGMLAPLVKITNQKRVLEDWQPPLKAGAGWLRQTPSDSPGRQRKPAGPRREPAVTADAAA